MGRNQETLGDGKPTGARGSGSKMRETEVADGRRAHWAEAADNAVGRPEERARRVVRGERKRNAALVSAYLVDWIKRTASWCVPTLSIASLCRPSEIYFALFLHLPSNYPYLWIGGRV